MSEENKEIEKFDPSKLMDGVKSRIKATFVSLIPDAQWEQMCQSEMDKFFKPIPELDYNNRPNGKFNPSEFENIITEMMKEKVKEYFKELLSKPEYAINTVWKNNNNVSTLPEHLEDMIKEKMPDMLQAMIGNIMASSFQQFFNQIQNTLQRGY